MKKIILLMGLFAFYQIVYGQCDKKITLKCHKARALHYGSAGEEIPMEATFSIDKDKITLTASFKGETEIVEGEIREVVTCEWTDYLKNGKTQYKALMKKVNENPENSIIDIESENGRTKITCKSDPDTGSQLQFDVTEYTITEEVNTTNAPGQPVQNDKKSKRKSKAGKK